MTAAATNWRFRVTKTVGGHASGNPLIALQELEIRAVSASGKELLPMGASGEGEYPMGAGPSQLFDKDPDALPCVDDGVVTGAKEELGTLAWTYDEPACVSAIRLQTAKSGWWSCWDSESHTLTGHCSDPTQWVLEGEFESEWKAVMTQGTDYALPAGRMEYTPWLTIST
jgi:hypothetical protein